MVTDHSSLVWIFKTQKPNARLVWCALRLQEFTFAVEYRKGKYNTVPGETTGLFQPICATMLATQKPTTVKELPISDEVIWKAQQEDPHIQELYQSILKKGEVCVNAYTINFHEDPLTGHLVYWPRLSLEVRDHVRSCQVCQAYKPESSGRKASTNYRLTTLGDGWSRPDGSISEKFKEELHLVVFVDYYSQWVELFPLRKAKAESVLKILIQEILTHWGVPETSKEWSLKHKMTTAYHPQTNLTERINRTLKTMIA